MSPRHFILRLVRGGALVPARMRWLDHEPGEPENKRDRWPELLMVVDIAGEIRPPEELLERMHIKLGHWKYPQPVSEAEYRYQVDRLRWAEGNQLHDPALKPRRRIDPRQMPLPNFDRENAV